MHGGLLRLAVKTGLGVGQVLAGQDDLLFDHHRLAIALQKALGAKRHWATARLSRAGVGTFVDHADFQGGGAAQDVFGLGRVLHAGQLHHDAVLALLLDHRLGHAKFVDAVVQSGDVLLERLLLHQARGHGLDAGDHFEAVGLWGLHRGQVREFGLDQAFARLQHGGVAKADFHCLAAAADAAVAHSFVTKGTAQIAGQGFSLFAQGRLHVHLQHEMHAAAQVQTQVHGRGMQSA